MVGLANSTLNLPWTSLSSTRPSSTLGSTEFSPAPRALHRTFLLPASRPYYMAPAFLKLDFTHL